MPFRPPIVFAQLLTKSPGEWAVEKFLLPPGHAIEARADPSIPPRESRHRHEAAPEEPDGCWDRHGCEATQGIAAEAGHYETRELVIAREVGIEKFVPARSVEMPDVQTQKILFAADPQR